MEKTGKRIKADERVWKIAKLKRHWFNTIRNMSIHLSQVLGNQQLTVDAYDFSQLCHLV